MTTIKIKKACLVLLLCAAAACTVNPRTARERYVEAYRYKAAGNAKHYRTALVALAHEAPETRAGRRALATIEGGNALAILGLLGVVAAVAVPSFIKYQKRAHAAANTQH